MANPMTSSKKEKKKAVDIVHILWYISFAM